MSERETEGVEFPAVPRLGAMLRMAREARGMAISDVAAVLKMSPRQIEALESEDFSRLPGPTFVRGFIRNYARLLKIDAAPVLGALPEQAAPSLTELNVPRDAGVRILSTNVRQGKGVLGATLLALIALGVALAFFFDMIDPAALQPARQAGSQALAPPVDAVQVAQPQLTAEAAAESAKTMPPSDGAAMQRLIFSFDGRSWVEVRDGSGRTVFSQLNAKGSTQVVEGLPPFQLVVGNASQVRLQYKDQAVDLRPHTRVDVARLTLE